MTKIVLNLSLPMARKVLAALNSPSVTDEKLSKLYYELQEKIAAAKREKKPK